MAFHVIAYGSLTFLWDPGIHFIHLYGVLFVIEFALLCIWRRAKAPIPIHSQTPADGTFDATFDSTPWRYRYVVSTMLLAGIVATYLLFSPFGVAS